MQKYIQRDIVVRHKAAFGLNIAIIVFVFLGFTFLFGKLHPTGVFPNYGAINLRLFSTIVNIMAGISAIMMIVFLSSKEKRENAVIPKWAYLVNFITTSSLFFNMIMMFAYLLPVCATLKTYDVEWLFTGTNMLFYVIVPLLAISQYVFCLPKTTAKFKDSFYCLAPIAIYLIVYTIYALCHINSLGLIDSQFDWYGFCHYDPKYIILAIVICLGLVYGLSLALFYGNKYLRINTTILDIVLNVIILFLCIVGIVWLFYNAVASQEGGSGWTSSAKRFYYFTNWSNFLMLISSTITIAFASLKLIGARKYIPDWVRICQFTAVVLTAIVLFFELCVTAPVNFFSAKSMQEGIDAAWRVCFKHHLMFSHLWVPIVSIFTYIVIEHNNVKRKWCLVAATPLGIYCLIYMIVLYANYNTPWSKGVWWDVYSILGYLNYKIIWFVPIFLYGFSFLISWLIWLANTRVHKAIGKNKIVA